MNSAQDTSVLASRDSDDLVQRVGQLTRMLRDSMRELGLNHEVEKAAQAIPDARDRLNYVASMTEQAAERALNAIDQAQPLQNDLEAQATGLEGRWDDWFREPVALDEAKDLVSDTRAFLHAVPKITQATNQQLLDIMMAQDFQDLTGQVIKKMMDVIREVEQQLLQVLLDSMADGKDRETMRRIIDEPGGGNLMNGPQVNAEREDVLNSQDQVDSLLEDLGF